MRNILKCPHCGKKNYNVEELFSIMHSDGDTVEAPCEHCEKSIKVMLHVDTWFEVLPLKRRR